MQLHEMDLLVKLLVGKIRHLNEASSRHHWVLGNTIALKGFTCPAIMQVRHTVPNWHPHGCLNPEFPRRILSTASHSLHQLVSFIPWDIPLLADNQCYLFHLWTIIMFWLICIFSTSYSFILINQINQFVY